MELADYANLAEIIGTAAIVISLIYVAIQIRQNTRATRLSTAQNISHEVREVTGLMASDMQMAEVHLKGITEIGLLSPPEKHRFYLFLSALYRVYENAYYQNQEGALDPHVWQSVVRQLLITRQSSGYQAYWIDRKDLFSEPFQNFVENELPEPKLDPLVAYRAAEAHAPAS